MPTISYFYGIAIRMYPADHAPPHFHAEYQGEVAAFDFEGRLIAGSIQQTAARLVREWALARRAELEENWARAVKRAVLSKIAPLE